MLALCVAASVLASPQPAWATQDKPTKQTKGSPRSNDGVAARVNGEPVTRKDLQRLLANPAERRRLLEAIGDETPENEVLDRLALQRLIDRRLILQEAARRKFSISEPDLDKAVTGLRRRFADLKDLGLWMKDQGLDDKSLFDTIRDEMLAARVAAALVEGVRVSDDQVRQYYEDHQEDLKADEVHLQLIVVKDEAAAADVLAALQRGEDFGELARKWSAGLRATRGGDTGWVYSATLWPPLRQAVAAMSPRQANGPLKKGDEFLVVRLHDRRPGRLMTLDEARPDIERRLAPARHQAAVAAWLSEQAKQAKIEMFSHVR